MKIKFEPSACDHILIKDLSGDVIEVIRQSELFDDVNPTDSLVKVRIKYHVKDTYTKQSISNIALKQTIESLEI